VNHLELTRNATCSLAGRLTVQVHLPHLRSRETSFATGCVRQLGPSPGETTVKNRSQSAKLCPVAVGQGPTEAPERPPNDTPGEAGLNWGQRTDSVGFQAVGGDDIREAEGHSRAWESMTVSLLIVEPVGIGAIVWESCEELLEVGKGSLPLRTLMWRLCTGNSLLT
jgi:hypothetical protein